ncbi:MAG: DNA cytosine methyltransferase, partial [Gemmatimonadaceae bacterium]|nr:DNA cytosine methyltransferase [Gemmatimonadaceae bacterium]
MGGIGVALRSLGYDVSRAFDSWAQAVAVYNHNFGEGSAEVCNLLSSSGRTRVVDTAKELGEIELLAAGPPCKGFSRLRNGHHDGRNGHNRVLMVIPDYIGILRPRMFVIENVPDLIRHRQGLTIAEVVRRLRAPVDGLCYTVKYETYDAAQFGTPQARRRVLIFGVRSGEALTLPVAGPDLTALYSALRHSGPVPKELSEYRAALRDPEDSTLTTARQALSDLPILGPGSLADEA